LALPTRELERITVEPAAGKFREFAELRDALLDLIASLSEQSWLEREIVPGGKVREEATILDNITEAAANFHDRFGCDLLAIKLDFAAVSSNEPHDQAKDGGLAATARADQGGHLTALDFEIDVADSEIGSEKFTDVAKVNEGVHENQQLQHEEKEAE
jgi:hypothetical protein